MTLFNIHSRIYIYIAQEYHQKCYNHLKLQTSQCNMAISSVLTFVSTSI